MAPLTSRGAGKLSSFYAGGYMGKWEYFVAGPPIEQMSDAAEEASVAGVWSMPATRSALNTSYIFENEGPMCPRFSLSGALML